MFILIIQCDSESEYILTGQRLSDGTRVTFMLPSAEPVIKKSSKASSARALMAESWAWKVWSSCLWRMSNTHTKPFLPPVISSCCF